MERHLADRLGTVAPSGLMEMLKLGERMAAEGREIVFLAQGEPDFDTPVHIKQAGAETLRNEPILYASPQGTLALREQVAASVGSSHGLQVSPQEVLITSGSTMGLYLALMATINPGDEVLIFDPGFGPYLNMVNLAGGRPVFIPTREVEGQFRPDPQVVESCITPRSKAILLNAPANPTGVVFTASELLALGELALRHDLLIISDEVYAKLVFDPHVHVSIASLAPELRERTILLTSLSKTYAMTGWRVGYTVANAALTRGMTEMMLYSGRCVPTFIQRAAIVALSGPQDCVTAMRDEYARRREVLVPGLNAIEGLRCRAPQGTFYTFVDARSIDPDSWRLARGLIEKAGVVTSPGRHYGPTGEGYLRISFATSIEQIRRGLELLASALPALRVER